MDESLAKISYRSLELLCRHQAKLSTTAETRDVLEHMALEYKQLADWQEQQWPGSPEGNHVGEYREL